MINQSALVEKEKGNQFFKKGDYISAVDCYSKAIELDQENHLLYGNRAQAYLNLNKALEAVEDCDNALQLNPSYVKGYLRRGSGYKALNQYKRALDDFKQALQLEPGNKQALKEIKELSSFKPVARIEPISSSNTNSNEESVKKIVNKEPLVPKKTIPLTKKVIDRIPGNSFEFYCDWRELTDDSSKLEYIKKIGPTKMGKIFQQHILEPLIFCDILRILSSCNDISFRSNLLFELSKMEKFKTLILFLEDHEEQILKNLIKDIKSSLEPSQFDYFISRVDPKFI